MVLDRERADARAMPSLVDRPCEYPDARAPGSRGPYVYAGGWALRLGAEESPEAVLRALGAAPLSERVPVLAVGSNAYPRQLLDKFGERPPGEDAVPTLRAAVPGLAICYAAALSGKGYVPATVRAAPGAVCATWLQWLTAWQLRAIARTEGQAYRLVSVPGAEVGVMGWRGRALAWAHGRLLDLGEGPVGLEAVSQAALLGGGLAAVAGEAAWDGCRLPGGLEEAVRGHFRGAARANDLPAGWVEIERDGWDFTAALGGGG